MEFVGIVMIVGLIILPSILLVVSFYSGVQRASRLAPSTRPLFLYPLICSFLLTGGFVIWQFTVISTSRSSTACIGYFFLPIFSFVVALAAFVVSWAILYVGWFINQRIRRTPMRIAQFLLLALAIGVLATTGYVAQAKITRHRLLNEATSGYNVDRLVAILEEGISSHDFDVLANLAKNPNTPVNDLVRLYDFCKPRISQLGGSESSILLPLARNPNTPPDTLTALASCRQSWIRNSVVRNPNTSIGTLRQLTADQDEFVKRDAKGELRLREKERKPETE